MKQYLELLNSILANAIDKDDRTGVGVISQFGYQMRFDLQQGFPLVTTKKLHLKSIIYELLWFLKGDTNIKYLNDNGVHIWDEWADKNGYLGPIYGKQWISWQGADGKEYNQIDQTIKTIKQNPNSRRIIVNSWNVPYLPNENIKPQENVKNGNMALAPCHMFFQFYVQDNKLSCQLYQRSADCFLGVPFNIASYALLTHMVAQQTNLKPGDFIWTGGDVHLYKNTLEQAKLQVSREPYPLPQLQIKRKPKSIYDYNFEDFEIINYQYHPHIKATVAV